MKYNKKITEWKHKQEIQLYKREIVTKEKISQTVKISKPRTSYENMSKKEKNISDQRRQKYYRNRIFYLTDLAIHNGLDTFITLTFKDPITDYSLAQHEWDLFIKRLKYREGKNLKYLAVHELQKKRGNVFHFHALMNLGYFPVKKLEEIWGKGFVFIESLREGLEEDKIKQIMYSFKYISKDIMDDTEKEQRSTKRKIYVSRNLEKPLVRKESSDEKFEDIVFQNMEKVISAGSYDIKDYQNRKLNEVDFIKIKKE